MLIFAASRNNTFFEISNHLGNVHLVLSDYRSVTGDASDTITGYHSSVSSASEYYPLGVLLEGEYNSESYRYGVNAMEKDDEIAGKRNLYATKFRKYDARLGRWLNIDPLVRKYPYHSPYIPYNTNPVFYIDPTGLEGESSTQTKRVLSYQYHGDSYHTITESIYETKYEYRDDRSARTRVTTITKTTAHIRKSKNEQGKYKIEDVSYTVTTERIVHSRQVKRKRSIVETGTSTRSTYYSWEIPGSSSGSGPTSTDFGNTRPPGSSVIFDNAGGVLENFVNERGVGDNYWKNNEARDPMLSKLVCGQREWVWVR